MKVLGKINVFKFQANDSTLYYILHCVMQWVDACASFGSTSAATLCRSPNGRKVTVTFCPFSWQYYDRQQLILHTKYVLGIQNIQTFPQYRSSSIHIRHDRQAMFTVLQRLNLITPDRELAANHIRNSQWFRDYIQPNIDARKQMWFSIFKPPETKSNSSIGHLTNFATVSQLRKIHEVSVEHITTKAASIHSI